MYLPKALLAIFSRATFYRFVLVCITGCLASCATSNRDDEWTVVSVVGTNDVHGELDAEFGGLAAYSGYVDALRRVRADDGAVVLIDAGDMWQGTLESNLNEGASVLAAYNALGYDAATIGNHEFDFGPIGPDAIPVGVADDPQGVIKARAAEANFPLLTANIIDNSTGAPVSWPNVRPWVMIERAGVRIGIIGVTTEETLETTISANTKGLSIAPLAATIATHARRLRADGADVVIVTAHAGGVCATLGEPRQISDCNLNNEIFRTANALPSGLVDQIVAGHYHRPLAHIVNGIAITSNEAGARSFGRVDYRIDLNTRRILKRTVFQPQPVCRFVVGRAIACAKSDANGASVAEYESHVVQPMATVARIARNANTIAETIKSEPLGVRLDAPVTRDNEPYSLLGRLMTDAIKEATQSDVAIHNVVGGIRADLPAGALTYGDVFRVFPFDNRVGFLNLTVAQLKEVFAAQVPDTSRRAGVSGLRITVTCDQGVMAIDVARPDGQSISDSTVLRVVVNDFLLLGGSGILAPITPEGGFTLDFSQPRVRDVWVAWFRAHGAGISGEDYAGDAQQRWLIPEPLPAECRWTR